jgi:hypothetical protein
LPLLSVTEPVAAPPLPATETVTERLWTVVMLLNAGITVTVGVTGFCGTELLCPPPPQAPIQAAATATRPTESDFKTRFIEQSIFAS